MRKWTAMLATLMIVGNAGKAVGQTLPSAPVFNVNTDDELVLKTLPAARMACPGLDRYADQFESVRVENHFRTSIVFHVPEASKVPDAYKAGGHNCFIEIENDGGAILVEKLACKSVCLDQVKVPDGQLKLKLESEEDIKRRECLTSYDYDPATKETFELPKPEHCAKGRAATNG